MVRSHKYKRKLGFFSHFFIFPITAAINETSMSDSVMAKCHVEWLQYVVSFLVLWSVALATEVAIVVVSMRGTIFSDGPRRMAEFLLYVKLSEFC